MYNVYYEFTNADDNKVLRFFTAEYSSKENAEAYYESIVDEFIAARQEDDDTYRLRLIFSQGKGEKEKILKICDRIGSRTPSFRRIRLYDMCYCIIDEVRDDIYDDTDLGKFCHSYNADWGKLLDLNGNELRTFDRDGK